MSHQHSDAPDRHSPSAPLTAPHTEASRRRADPSTAVQLGIVVGFVAALVVASYPVAVTASVAIVTAIGMVTTAVGRAIDRAAARETTVRVPGAGVEVTVAHSSSE
ncbi:hypothetical protein GL213_09230 [Halogeometricum borinquense]|uniref:Uncharacterized protein n=1 Tax=Halogeometricum borinquense TaxID=60847 RepID=A0A6C0UFF3_9EURY|nr:hypothetical protein [Halogeometricum borinquense]QIB74105.1 hypothetical protein G3I44_07245 [Halogeometricum borinquense]QIQ76689.1 hypothetical protein GL213_09230 [Halogeometricum borinquense]